jgi:hypothetical protein
MSDQPGRTLGRIAYYQGRRNEVPNQELAKDLGLHLPDQIPHTAWAATGAAARCGSSPPTRQTSRVRRWRDPNVG